jgi:hypothetical protein
MSKLLISSLITLVACASFLGQLDSGYYEKIDPKSGVTHLSILFTHNINGETQPCGCRKFPLGGLEQVAGHFHQVSLETPYVYVDTGDLLFPSPILPEHVHTSMRFTADNLIEALEKLNLSFFVPGDQDFALGINYLVDVSKRVSFTFLLANATNSNPIKSKKFARIKSGEKSIVFIGVIDPDLLASIDQKFFTSPAKAIKQTIEEAQVEDSEIVILLSHSGMETDKKYAQDFPRLNFIIGAHSQSYTTRVVEENKSQIMQVLARNHFIGRLQIPLGEQDSQSIFGLLETREETKDLVKPNPMADLLKNWKTGLAKVQLEEQQKHTAQFPQDPLPTFNSCLECHQKQTEFWQTTSHAHAWHTLVSKQSDNDTTCVGCHSAGWQHPQGFQATPARIRFNGDLDDKKLAQYSKALHENYKSVKSVRALNTGQRKGLGKKYFKLIETHKVSHDYTNVQCINCHDKKRDHPFDGTLANDGTDMTSKCLQCHTQDQSPEWYQDNKPNQLVIKQQLKKVACPTGK